MNIKNNELYDVTPYFFNENIKSKHRVFEKKINGINYFFKTGGFLYNELLANEIFKLLDIPCVEQKLVKIYNDYFLMSKDYKKDNHVYCNGFELYNCYSKSMTCKEKNAQKLIPLLDSNGSEYFFPYNSLETIEDMLKYFEVSTKDLNRIMDTFVKYYSMSIILLDYDFHPGNWEIEFGPINTKVVPKFDNEQIFCSALSKPSFIVSPDESEPTFTTSIKYFLENANVFEKNIFKDLYYLCDESLIEEAQYNLQKKYGKLLSEYLQKKEYKYSKSCNIQRFIDNRNEISSIINDMEIRRR